MSLRGFFGRRLLRLHPLVVSGTLIGLVVFFAQGMGCPLWDRTLRAIHNWWVRTYSAGFSAGFCVALGVCEYLALAALTYVMMRFWDRPVRRMILLVAARVHPTS